MGYRLGVDLGTTFTSAAVARDGRAEALSLGDHAPQIPSVIWKAADGRLVVGETAVRRAGEEPDRVAREFKRRIGDKTSFFLGGSPMSPHALTGELLGQVVEKVVRGQGGAPDEVVLTCPANWGSYRRELMDQVVSISGLPAARLCTEPEAAALHFSATGRLADGESIAVYDLGGGTFDAAVLRQESSGFAFLGKAEGIEQLGGLDFDDAVFEYVRDAVDLPPEAFDDPALVPGLRRLRRECTDAKEALSHETAVTIPVDLVGARTSVRLTRAELEELIGPSIEKTVDCLERAVQRAGLTPDGLAAVVMVGGSARIPMVSEQVSRRLGRPVALSPQPKLCVAMGAALSADLAASRAAVAAAPPTTPAATAPPTAPVEAAPAPAADPAPAVPDQGAKPAEPIPAGVPSAPAAGVAPAVENVGESGRHRRTEQTRASGSGRRTGYALAATGLLLAGLGVAFLGPTSPVSGKLSWDVAAARTQALPATTPVGAQLSPTLLDVELPGDPMKLDPANRTFPVSDGHKLFLAGPVVAVLEPSGREFLLERSGGSWWSPFATIPGGALIVGLLFGIAYAESLLRELRHRHGMVRAGELLGMAGVGVVLGLVLTLLAWISGRLLTPVSVVLVVVSLSASAGLLSFAVASRRKRAVRRT